MTFPVNLSLVALPIVPKVGFSFIVLLYFTIFVFLKGNSGVKMKLFCIVGLYFLRQYLATVFIDRWSERTYFTVKTTKKRE